MANLDAKKCVGIWRFFLIAVRSVVHCRPPFGLNFLRAKKFLAFGAQAWKKAVAKQWRYYSKALSGGSSAVAASFPITMQMVWHTAIQKVGDKALTFVAENYCVWLGLSLTEKLNKNQSKKEYSLCPKIELPMVR